MNKMRQNSFKMNLTIKVFLDLLNLQATNSNYLSKITHKICNKTMLHSNQCGIPNRLYEYTTVERIVSIPVVLDSFVRYVSFVNYAMTPCSRYWFLYTNM